jgi:hypothetical protein
MRLFQDVTIQSDDGSIRVVPWSLIANASADATNLQAAANWRADVGLTAPANRTGANALFPDDLLEPGPGRVQVDVESDGAPQSIGVRAHDRGPFAEEPVVVCTTPCTLYVRPGMLPLFAIGPDDHARDYPIAVTSSGARVVLPAGSTARRAIGIAIIPIGAVGVVAGVILAMCPTPPTVGGLDAGSMLAIGGVVMVVSGGALLRRAQPGVRSVEPLAIDGLGFRF